MDTLRFEALKPVGLINPDTGLRPWAVVQLRAENRQCSAYNLVGFQTNLTFKEQERIFRMIPGLEAARFSRYGVMHRNTFIDAPRLLTPTLSWREHPQIHFAGQLTGTEGYVEAIASGLVAALAVYAQTLGKVLPALPIASLFGALLHYATDIDTIQYQPMHVNYGIMSTTETKPRNKRERYTQYAQQARLAMQNYRTRHTWLDWLPALSPEFLINENDSSQEKNDG
jgi:methylenetetrahydrofolate--tRNA-(uracil-5-)-methyltransferase